MTWMYPILNGVFPRCIRWDSVWSNSSASSHSAMFVPIRINWPAAKESMLHCLFYRVHEQTVWETIMNSHKQMENVHRIIPWMPRKSHRDCRCTCTCDAQLTLRVDKTRKCFTVTAELTCFEKNFRAESTGVWLTASKSNPRACCQGLNVLIHSEIYGRKGLLNHLQEWNDKAKVFISAGLTHHVP